MSVEKAWEDAAYFGALVDYFCAHPSDSETDEEVADILGRQPWLSGVLISVLELASAERKAAQGVVA